MFNYAGGPHLDLANIEWVVDESRAYAENTTGRKDYRTDSGLSRNYFSHPGYANRDTLPIA